MTSGMINLLYEVTPEEIRQAQSDNAEFMIILILLFIVVLTGMAVARFIIRLKAGSFFAAANTEAPFDQINQGQALVQHPNPVTARNLNKQAAPVHIRDEESSSLISIPAPKTLAPVEKSTALSVIENLYNPDVIPPWWENLLRTLNHAMIIGPTDAGKSTFVRGMIQTVQKYGKVIIVDAHRRFDWPIDPIGYAHNWPAIKKALSFVTAEFNRRSELTNLDKSYIPEDWFVFVDEFVGISQELEETAATFMKIMGNEARKYRIHIILIGQTDSVEALNIRGQGNIRQNYTTFYLGPPAYELKKEYYNSLYLLGSPDYYPCVVKVAKNDFVVVQRPFIPYLSSLPVDSSRFITIPNLPAKEYKYVDQATLQKYRDNLDEREETQTAVSMAGAGVNFPQESYNPVEVDTTVKNLIKAALFIGANKTASIRQLAEHLYGSGNGRHSVWAKALALQVKELTGITLDKLSGDGQKQETNEPLLKAVGQ